METQTAPRTGLHPLVATAAVAVTLGSLVGIAAMTGFLPTGTAKQAEPAFAKQAEPAFVVQSAPTSTAAPAPAPQPVVAAQAAPAPVPAVKAAPRPKPVVHKAPVVHEAPVQVAQSRAPAAGSYPGVPPDTRAPAQAPAETPAETPVQAPLEARRPAPVVAAKATCYDCGSVESMREVDQKGEGTGLGAIAGGIGGLILGNQIGKGTGNKIATVLGAAGGAYAGHQVEKNARTTKSYETSVRMEDGSYRTIASTSAPAWRTGDHVRVVNGALQADNR